MCKTDYGGGGGGKNVPKIDYVICERPLISTEGAKSQYPYVGLNSSVTDCLIEIILPGMTYYHH